MGSYRIAPEWARQAAVILIWPHSNSDWKSQLDEIEKTYIELSRYISRHQKLILVAYDQTQMQHIQDTLTNHCIHKDNILIIDIPTNDTWVRDFGPIFVKSENEAENEPENESALLDFEFNAWGDKFEHDYDNQFNQAFKQSLKLDSPLQDIKFVFEAGNLEVNSKNTLLISSTCFNRSSMMSSKDLGKDHDKDLASLELKFNQWFGCNQVLWIHNVKLKGDDTEGHIDTLARFCSDDVIAYCAAGHHADPNNDALNSLATQLKEVKRNNHAIAELVPLPCPQPIFHNGSQLPASYANFLITNHNIFVPVFSDKQDNHALKTLDDLFPSHEIIDIESNTLIKQYGGIHCATMQIPEGFLK